MTNKLSHLLFQEIHDSELYMKKLTEFENKVGFTEIDTARTLKGVLKSYMNLVNSFITDNKNREEIGNRLQGINITNGKYHDYVIRDYNFQESEPDFFELVNEETSRMVRFRDNVMDEPN